MAELEINNTQELTEKLNEIVKDPSTNKPSEEEVAQAKEEFDAAAKEWTLKLYDIGTPADAQEVCDYIKHFLMNRFFWQKDAWMGVIKLTEEINAAEKLFKGVKDKSLQLGYQALEFTFYVLTNPGGFGLQAALDFESENDVYVKVLTLLGTQLESARKAAKDVEFLQQRWAAMSQGFYLEVEDLETEEELTEEQKEETPNESEGN